MFMDRKTQYFQMSVLPKVTYRFSTIPIKVPASYFLWISTNLEFTWKGKRPRTANTILKEKNQDGLMLPNFKLTVKLQ